MAISVKNHNPLGCRLFLILLVLSSYSRANQTHPTVQLQTLHQVSSGWKTLLYVDNNTLSGRFRDLIDCSFEQIPFEVNYGFGPFSRIQRQVQINLADGFFPANLTAERLKYATPSITLINDHKVLIRRATKPLTRKLRVAAMRGAAQELEISRRLSDLVFPINNYNQLVDMLHTGRIDAIVGSQLFFSVTEEFDKLDKQFVTHRLEDSSMRAFFGNTFLKNNPSFLTQFNTALIQCKQHSSQPPESTKPNPSVDPLPPVGAIAEAIEPTPPS
jgi:polar amino acid transport system substrate-binding protein